MSLIDAAREVLTIINDGGYKRIDGSWVNLEVEIDSAVKGTKTYTPAMCAQLPIESDYAVKATRFEVTGESTQVATKRLIREGVRDPLVLNFASAKNPGGSFLRGTIAQEEGLVRCSCLYACLKDQTTYYEANRQQISSIYTDHIIYSPKVPWFRVRSEDPPGDVFFASIITAPAPNATESDALVAHQDVSATFARRLQYILRIAKTRGHTSLVLGAWGCGEFGNDPSMVAEVFANCFESEEFAGYFDRVVFAVLHNNKTKDNFETFLSQFR